MEVKKRMDVFSGDDSKERADPSLVENVFFICSISGTQLYKLFGWLNGKLSQHWLPYSYFFELVCLPYS
jgi:hypothetical protein